MNSEVIDNHAGRFTALFNVILAMFSTKKQAIKKLKKKKKKYKVRPPGGSGGLPGFYNSGHYHTSSGGW